MKVNKFFIGFVILFAIIILLGGYFIIQYNLLNTIMELINQSTPTSVFIPLMLVLPAFGFPVSAFLVITGIKYGVTIGLMVIIAMIPAHLVLSYFFTKTIKSMTQKILTRWKHKIPQVPGKKIFGFCSFIFLVPGIPYAVRNVIVPMSGIQLRQYFWVGWLCHLLMSIPIVVLGSSTVDMSLELFMASIVFFIVLYVFQALVVPRLPGMKDKDIKPLS